ncbi:carboxypeptidase-like regulatory domain-containing protein [Flavivirga amylovorans]|uniref:Carboxypeptidase-like regulatory domain-containing protein n=1 Tax=Flavivirga amylovorans TaxID=870486 RepID=A0ABT8X200_9FLAO|nr:carboxypeptidase-like regulatory domain-containing protein [Flavivirga amylovorans]MDO5987979.1 carboxypeptidase-like regulatory domain-containing protein [Flavivirga amylovorans]
MKALLTFIIVLTTSIQIQGQERLISGKVTSASDNLPLAGANILIKGTGKGVTANFEGLYQIKVKPTDILVFNYLGFVTQEKKVGTLNTISVVLEEDTSSLDEIVIMGYGTTKRKEITSAVTTVKSESVSSALSGKVRGVKINNQEPQSGLLTAGEINDLEKWGEWKENLKKDEYKEIQQNWNFYLENKIQVAINDNNGVPLNNIKVSLFNETNQLIMAARTDFTGEVTLFKDLNQKCEDDYYTVQIRQNDKIFGKKITNTYNRIEFTLDEQSQSNDIDVMFTIDATGSMGDEINYLKSELKNIITRLDKSIDDKRVALTFYRDFGDAYVVKDFDFNSDIDAVKDILSHQGAGGGGDYEEAVEQALKVSMSKSWNTNAKAKLLFLLLDAPPHFTKENVAIIKEQIKLAQAKGIKIIPVVASGANKNVEFLMRFFSVSTNGTYVFITDDSGIGNPHLKPSTDNFEVEKLNDLIVRLIEKYSGVIS